MENSFVPGLAVDRATWRDILAEFMPSEVMRRHLEPFAPTKEQLLGLICLAPVPIGRKLGWLQKLACDAAFAARAAELRQAMDALELKPDEVFHLRKLWYDTENACVRECADNGRLFRSLEKAVSHIGFSLFAEGLETPPGEDVLIWFVLEKWAPDQTMEMKRVYRYYFIGRDICFVRREGGVCDGVGRRTNLHFLQSPLRGPTFRFPAPVAPGDVVVIDRRPFQPVVKAVVLTVEDDEFGPVALFQDPYGRWKAERLESFFFASPHSEPWEPLQDKVHLFPLYGLGLPDGPLGDEDGVLKMVQDYIAGSEEQGMKIWEELYWEEYEAEMG